MNLAEIRKKAAEARKLDDTEHSSLVEPVINISDIMIDHAERAEQVENLCSELDSDTEPDSDVCPDLEEPPPVDSENLINAAGEDFSSLMPIAETDPVPGHSLPMVDVDSTKSESIQVAPQIKNSSYNPLALIIEGRIAASGDEEAAFADAHNFASTQVQEYLCFKVADEEYALSILVIKEIIKPREVTEVPRMPDFITGVISLRGVIIPVMDMRLRLSLPVGVTTGRERILVLRSPSGLCGVLVDEVVQVVKIHDSAIEGPPAVLDGIDREFVQGLGRYDNRMLILLSLESILDLEIH